MRPAVSSVTWSSDVATYTDGSEAGPSAGLQPPTLTGARRAFSEPARNNGPEMIPWDEGKRRLPLHSPTGVSPAAKKSMRWSHPDDQVLLRDLLPEMPGSSARPPHVPPEDNLSEASDDTAPNLAMDHFDFGGNPHHRQQLQYYDQACITACEPTVDREFIGKKEVPMWTVEEDLLILQLVEQYGKRWSKIAAHLPGRTDNGVRNRWNRMEKAQTLRHRNGAEQGYRCRRCGQPKRGHICAALTQNGMLEGDSLALKAAELTALSAQRMQAMVPVKHAGGRAVPALRSSRSLPNQRHAQAHAEAEPLKPLELSPLKQVPTASLKPSGKAPQGKPAEPLVEMDEVQLDDFLTELHLSLATPTNADRMQHAAAMAAGQQAAAMAAAGQHAAAVAAGQRAAAIAAGMRAGQPSPVQDVPTMPPAYAHRYLPHFTGAPASCVSTGSGSAPPAGLSSMARPSPTKYFFAQHGSHAMGYPPFPLPSRGGSSEGHSRSMLSRDTSTVSHASTESHALSRGGSTESHPLSRGGSTEVSGDSEDLVASISHEPAILPQPSTDSMLANAMPAVSLANSFGHRVSRGEDVPKTNLQRGNGLNKPTLTIEC